MENEFELKPFDKVLVRDYDNTEWRAEFYMKYIEDSKYKYLCLITAYIQCIPYEGNEHLLGTTESPQEECPKEETEKKDEVSNNYGYPVEYFKRNDVVLCRDAEDEEWHITSFVAKGNEQYPFQCPFYRWKNCIPYEGNEHLLGTKNTPERYNPNKDTLFGVRLKPGYVLEFEDSLKSGVVFTTEGGLAVAYFVGGWQYLKNVRKDNIACIRGVAGHSSILSGDILWVRPALKMRVLTKAEIAEKYGMNVKDFEIIDEENEKNE